MACRKASGKEWPPSKAQFSSLGKNMVILPALLNLSILWPSPPSDDGLRLKKKHLKSPGKCIKSMDLFVKFCSDPRSKGCFGWLSQDDPPSLNHCIPSSNLLEPSKQGSTRVLWGENHLMWVFKKHIPKKNTELTWCLYIYIYKSIRLDFVAPNRSTILVSGLYTSPRVPKPCSESPAKLPIGIYICVVYLDVIMLYMT